MSYLFTATQGVVMRTVVTLSVAAPKQLRFRFLGAEKVDAAFLQTLSLHPRPLSPSLSLSLSLLHSPLRCASLVFSSRLFLAEFWS